MFSNLTHQFLGTVHKQPPQSESHACLGSLLSVTSAGGRGTGEQGIPGEDPRHLLLFTKPSRDREQVKGRGVEGDRSKEGQRFRPRLQAASSDTGPVSPRGTRGPRPSPELHERHFQPRHEPCFLWTPKATPHLFLLLAELGQVRRAGPPLPAAAARRRIRALTCLQSRPRPAQPPHGPQPARRPSAPCCPLRPRPAPGRRDPRLRRNLGAASLNSRDPSRQGFLVAGPVRLGPDVIRTTAGSSLLSSTTASWPTRLFLVNF